MYITDYEPMKTNVLRDTTICYGKFDWIFNKLGSKWQIPFYECLRTSNGIRGLGGGGGGGGGLFSLMD